MSTDSIQNEELVSPEMMEAMGISQPAYEEVMGIIGRMPTVQELSTLLAMWEANGKQQSLYGWLKGQHHVVEKHEYLYTGTDTTQVKIAGSDRETHELTLYNSYGTAVLKTTFTGSEYILNMSNLPQGIYMLSVDDMNAKTVKL